MKACISGTISICLLLGIFHSASAFTKISEPTRYFSVSGMAISGDYIYVGGKYGVAILDISDLDQPRYTGCISPGRTYGLLVEGDRLYVKQNSLLTYSIDDPANPTRVSNIALRYYPKRLRAHDGVLGASCGTMVIDPNHGDRYYGAVHFLDALNPQPTNYIADSDWLYNGIDWNGDYLYVGATVGGWTDRILIWNLAHQPHPNLITTTDIFHSDFLIHSERLIVLSYTLQSFSLDDPANPADPVTFPEFPDSGQVNGLLALEEDILYVSRRDTIYVYNIADPDNPEFVSKSDPYEGMYNMTVTDNKIAYQTPDAIHFIDASNPADLVEVSQVGISNGSAQRVQHCDSRLTLTAAEDGVYVYLTDDPDNPRHYVHLITEHKALDAIQRGNYLYCCIDREGLAAYDVSNPQQSAQTELFEGNYSSLTVWEDILYAFGPGGLNVYRLDDPAHPQLLSQNRNIRYGNAMRIEYPRLFVFSYHNISIVDVSNPEQTVVYQPPVPSDEMRDTRISDFEAIGNIGFETVDYYFPFYDELDGKRLFVLDISSLSEICVLDSFPLTSSTNYNLFNVGPFLGFTSGSRARAYDPAEIVRTHQLNPISDFGEDAPPISTALVGTTLYAASGAALTLYDLTDYLSAPSANTLPTDLTLLSTYPNPFNNSAIISYQIIKPGWCELIVMDLAGREVGRLANEWKSAGQYETVWDASQQSAGLYFLRLTAQGRSETAKLSVVK